jgi:hypothetical protein
MRRSPLPARVPLVTGTVRARAQAPRPTRPDRSATSDVVDQAAVTGPIRDR